MSLTRMRLLFLFAFGLLFSSCGSEDKGDSVADAPPAEAIPAEQVAPAEEVTPAQALAVVEEVAEVFISDALKSTLATIRPEERAAENPLAGQEEAVRKGGEEFMSLCAHCHGKEGKGDGPASKALGVSPGDLAVSSTTPGERFQIMKGGVTGTPMQSFGAAMSDKQIWSLIAYMESLRPAPEAEAQAPAEETSP